MDWNLINNMVNREALYDFTDRGLSLFEQADLWNFDPSDKHDWNELIYSYCMECNLN